MNIGFHIDISGATAFCAPNGSVWIPHVLRWWSLAGWLRWLLTPERNRLTWYGLETSGPVKVRLIRVAETHTHFQSPPESDEDDAPSHTVGPAVTLQ